MRATFFYVISQILSLIVEIFVRHPWLTKFFNFSNEMKRFLFLSFGRTKFCESPKKMKTCSRKETAATVHGKINEEHTEIMPRRVQVNCKCPKSHYWWLQKYTFEDDGTVAQKFRCQKVNSCPANIFSIFSMKAVSFFFFPANHVRPT